MMPTLVLLQEGFPVFVFAQAERLWDEVEFRNPSLHGGTHTIVLLQTVEETQLVGEELTVRDVVHNLLTWGHHHVTNVQYL